MTTPEAAPAPEAQTLLVTGGGGFLGSRIVRLLQEQGHRVRSFSRSPQPENAALGVEVINGDLTNAADVAHAAQGCDGVFHVAAKAGIWGSYASFYQPNVIGTRNVLAACKQHGIRYLVHTSTPSVVFSGESFEGANEFLPLQPVNPLSPYAATKALAEQEVLAASGAISGACVAMERRGDFLHGERAAASDSQANAFPADNFPVDKLTEGKPAADKPTADKPTVADLRGDDPAFFATTQAATGQRRDATSGSVGATAATSQGDGLRVCALRPHLIYGPGDPHLLPRLLARARGGRLRRVGDGRNRVDLTHVENAARAHLLAFAALQQADSPVAGKAYFISDGAPVSLWEWIDAYLQREGVPAVRSSISAQSAYRVGAVCEWLWRMLPLRGEPPMTRFVATELAKSHWFDISAARRDFGYAPQPYPY